MKISRIHGKLPKPLKALYCFFNCPEDIPSLLSFLTARNLKISFLKKLYIIKQLYVTSYAVICPHTQHQIISFIKTILSIPPDVKGVIVEAGSYKGGSSAKFSLAAKLANRRLFLFDSFEGIPNNKEPHKKSIFGHDLFFPKGSYCGLLDEVKGNISKYGDLSACEFIKGWFENTMPKFSQTIIAAYLDVDLASSTRTCLKYLYPLLAPGGVLYSQDGDFPLVINVFKDNKFWEKEVGFPKPYIEGLGKQKLIKIVKPFN